MIADFSEQSNSPRNPRKHRRLDDDPPDTGDPCGSSPSLPPSQSAPTDSRPPSYKDKLTGVASPPAPHQPSETEAFGPWMIVARKQRRGPKKTVVVDNSFASAPQVNTCFDPIMDEGVEVQPPEIVEPLRPPRFVTKGKLDAAKPTTASKPSKSVIHVRKPLSISQNVPTSRLSSIASSSFTFPSVPLSSKPIDRGNHYVVNIFENDDPNVVYAPIHQDKGSRSMPPGDPPDVQGLQARTSMVGMDFSQQDGSTLPSKLVIPSESNSDMCLDAAVVTASS
ncbi:hypothetical protein V6N13_131961 [Hibiscus sabdariffa]